VNRTRDPLVGVRLRPGMLAALDAEVARRQARWWAYKGAVSRSRVIVESLAAYLEVDRWGGPLRPAPALGARSPRAIKEDHGDGRAKEEAK